MNRLPVADWAASVPASGITGTIPASKIGPVDLSQVTWNGITSGPIPQWNGVRFVPVALPSSSSGTVFQPGDDPAFAVKTKQAGQPSAQSINTFRRYEANVKLFGATGNGGTDDTQAVNAAINAITSESGGTLYFPPGNYVLNGNQLNQITVACRVRGDGIGVSNLNFNNSRGFWFYQTDAALVDGISINEASIALEADSAEFNAFCVAVSSGTACMWLNPVESGSIANCLFASTGTAWGAVYGTAHNIHIYDNRVLDIGDWMNAFWLLEGENLLLHDNYVGNAGTAAVLLGTAVTDSRVSNTSFRNILGAEPVLNQGTNNYVSDQFGLGGNTNTLFDNRKNLIAQFAWDPPPMGSGYGYYDDFNIPGAAFGDQVIPGVPLVLPPTCTVQAQAVASDTVRITLINMGTSTLDVAPAQWRLRVIN